MKTESLGECPACEEGELYAVVIPALNLRGELCRECEAFWAEGEEITEDSADQLVALLHDVTHVAETARRVDVLSASIIAVGEKLGV